jgi:hypothetical protein
LMRLARCVPGTLGFDKSITDIDRSEQ